MKVQGIDIEKTVESVKKELSKDTTVSSSFRTAIELLLVLVSVLINTITLNSKNSSKPPSSDQNRKKRQRKKSNNKAGGQNGHQGTTLKQVENPDEIIEFQVELETLDNDRVFRYVGVEIRQVIDIEINQVVTEYRAQILQDELGNKIKAKFPDGVTKSVQYGNNIKANAVYMSHYQMIPYERVADNFKDQLGLAISTGSLFNFNKQAYQLLASFEQWAKRQLISANVLHVDETGINIASKRHWLHCASTSLITLFHPHQKRGKEAMDEMGVLPLFNGILCHDHWKPYFQYHSKHALCNAHHLRELERAFEQDNQQWAMDIKQLLLDANMAVIAAGGALDNNEYEKWQKQYRALIDKGNQECPPPEPNVKNKKRGRLKRSKARNLLERLAKFETETLQFMTSVETPFTNNQGENDIRMTKVQQKVSGCFRSFEGAQIFCRVRSYISTARKHGMSPTTALRMLFEGEIPDFMKNTH